MILSAIATPKRKRAPKKEQPLAAVVQPEIEVITVEDDVEVIEVVEKPPIKRRSPAGNLGKRSWQKTSVMRERMTGVTDKVAGNRRGEAGPNEFRYPEEGTSRLDSR